VIIHAHHLHLHCTEGGELIVETSSNRILIFASMRNILTSTNIVSSVPFLRILCSSFQQMKFKDFPLNLSRTTLATFTNMRRANNGATYLESENHAGFLAGPRSISITLWGEYSKQRCGVCKQMSSSFAQTNILCDSSFC
jgi:hypothetical protein